MTNDDSTYNVTYFNKTYMSFSVYEIKVIESNIGIRLGDKISDHP